MRHLNYSFNCLTFIDSLSCVQGGRWVRSTHREKVKPVHWKEPVCSHPSHQWFKAQFRISCSFVICKPTPHTRAWKKNTLQELSLALLTFCHLLAVSADHRISLWSQEYSKSKILWPQSSHWTCRKQRGGWRCNLCFYLRRFALKMKLNSSKFHISCLCNHTNLLNPKFSFPLSSWSGFLLLMYVFMIKIFVVYREKCSKVPFNIWLVVWKDWNFWSIALVI